MTGERWRRVEALYHEALALDARDRAAFLQEACAADEALRSEVESLLTEQASAEGFLDHPALEGLSAVSMDGSSLIGKQVGVYRLQALIGEGGMGQVFRATDSRLKRQVAIKILPRSFATNADRLVRFQREAEVLASLNHPHICTLHDVGRQDGIDFLVLEYVEGKTLAERLTKGPLSTPQALSIATQVADALDKAHRQGIVHRDLKPGNIMLTKGGAKLLDFGLAKLRPAATAGAGAPSAALTVHSSLTGVGSIVGTFQYMAPEQVEGKEADARTDIFAFGVVLYEMLTGKKAFEGKSQASLISAILEHEPTPPSVARPLTPPSIDHVVGRCLAKDPDDRWQSAGDVGHELTWITEGGDASRATNSQKMSRTRHWITGLTAGLVIGAVAIALVRAPGAGSNPIRSGTIRTFVSVAPAEQLRAFPMDQTEGEGRPGRPAMAVSPDGQFLVFSAVRGGQQQLYMRPLTDLEATPIGGTDGGHSPFFSPDGRWLGFSVGKPPAFASDLFKVAFPGAGTVQKVGTTPNGLVFGASWGSDDTIVFAQWTGGLWRIPASGGTAEPLTTLDATRDEFSHRLPSFLPGNQAVMFTVTYAQYPHWNATDIAVQSLTTGERKTLIKGGADARYLSSGHLVFMRVGTLMAVPFNLETLEVTGSPVAVASEVMQAIHFSMIPLDSGAGQFSVSESGMFVYLPGGPLPAPDGSMLWVTRAGAERPLEHCPPRSYISPRLSPDDGRFVFGTFHLGDRDIWVADVLGCSVIRQTDDGRSEVPLWTRDGTRIAFTVNHGNRHDLMVKAVEGGSAEHLVTRPNAAYAQSWMPDGSALAFTDSPPQSFGDTVAASAER